MDTQQILIMRKCSEEQKHDESVDQQERLRLPNYHGDGDREGINYLSDSEGQNADDNSSHEESKHREESGVRVSSDNSPESSFVDIDDISLNNSESV
mmetsp:Transcript_1624/g.2001  ORF Transcript_1624/g.2001 Transcript_1624/m.2001 type:complete len:97 (+) Transcript_1624:568-858(+)